MTIQSSQGPGLQGGRLESPAITPRYLEHKNYSQIPGAQELLPDTWSTIITPRYLEQKNYSQVPGAQLSQRVS